MNTQTINPGQYTVTIEDLENLGWDFDNVYDEGAKALGITREQNEKIVREKYDVVVTIRENGSTQFRLDAGSEFSDNEPTGDDNLTIRDITQLQESNDIIKFQEN